MYSKICGKCGLRLFGEKFSKNKASPDGLRSVCKDCMKSHGKRYHETDRVTYLLKKARMRARVNGLEFSITEADIKIPYECPVFKIAIVLDSHTGAVVDGSPSIDRIDSSLGYVKGNVRVISHRANVLKNNATLEELKLLVRDAKRIYSKRISSTI